MKRLILMRHGHSPPAQTSDAQRPLSTRGAAAASAALKKLAEKGFLPKMIVASPLLRAKSTAEIAAKCFNAPVIVMEELDGGHSCDAVWRELRTHIEKSDDVLVVGHQPVLGVLVGALVGGPACPLQPAGVCALRFDGAVPERLVRSAKEELCLLDPEIY